MLRGINLKNQLPGIGLGAVLCGICVMFGTSAVGCGNSDKVVALVNGEAITMDEFVKYMELKPQVRVQTANGVANLPVEGFLGLQALQDLVAQQVTLQLAKDKGMDPTAKDIADELEFREKLQKNFLLTLTERGLTLEMIRKSIKIDLIQERLLTEGIKVTDDDVKKFIAENKDRFVEPERGEVHWILVYDMPNRTKVDESLKSLTFSQVANRYSKDPRAKENNGRVRDANTGNDPVLASLPAEVGKLAEGGTTGWITVPNGWAKFNLKKRIPAKAVIPTEAQREAIRRELAKNEGASARNIDQMILQKLVKSKIDVEMSIYQQPWKNVVAKYKEEGKISDITGGAQ